MKITISYMTKIGPRFTFGSVNEQNLEFSFLLFI